MDRVQRMVECCEGLTLTIELYYFDGSNHSSKTTKYSFRYPFVFSFNTFKDQSGSINCTNDEISREITRISLVDFDNMSNLYEPFIQDPYFKLDKLRIISDFKLID